VSHLQDRVCNDMKTRYLADPKAAVKVPNTNASSASTSTLSTSSASRSRTMAPHMTPTGANVESELSSSTTTATTSPPPPTRQEQHPSSSQPVPSAILKPPPTTTSKTSPHLYNDYNDSLPDIIDDSENDLTEITSEKSLATSIMSVSTMSTSCKSLSSTSTRTLSTSTTTLSTTDHGLNACYHVTKYPLVDNCGNAGLYTGHLARDSDKPHGSGHMEYHAPPRSSSQDGTDDDDDVVGVMYQGQWLAGDWCGFGELTDATCTYQGGFFNNMKHGLGVLRYHNNTNDNDENENGQMLTYEGKFSLGTMHGKGHLLYPDGTKFWGYCNDQGLPHGRGKQWFVDGRVYDGEFDCGILQGHGRMTWPDGQFYLGEWMDGQRTGLGIEVLPNGELYYEGAFSNGSPAEASSFPMHPKSRGDFLLYRTSTSMGGDPTSPGTLLGKLPRQVHTRKNMRKNIRWMLKW
jgi:hypothetical protein